MSPLPADRVDLTSLILARNDVHPDGDWWFDPRSGECLYLGLDDDADLAMLVDGVHVLVPRRPQPRQDIDDFLAEAERWDGVGGAVVDRLWRASRGRGGARRFRDLVAASDAAAAWTAFAMAREGARALDWLVARGLVDAGSAEALRSGWAEADPDR